MHGGKGAHLLLVHQPPWVEDDRHRRWKSLREMRAQVSWGERSEGREKEKFDARAHKHLQNPHLLPAAH